jgi:transposase-like protein
LADFRSPPDVIVLAVRWYLRFGLSYRDVEELLAERSIEVDHVTVGTVALSPTASAKPGAVEALATRRHQETTWNTRPCPRSALFRWPSGGSRTG